MAYADLYSFPPAYDVSVTAGSVFYLFGLSRTYCGNFGDVRRHGLHCRLV